MIWGIVNMFLMLAVPPLLFLLLILLLGRIEELCFRVRDCVWFRWFKWSVLVAVSMLVTTLSVLEALQGGFGSIGDALKLSAVLLLLGLFVDLGTRTVRYRLGSPQIVDVEPTGTGRIILALSGSLRALDAYRKVRIITRFLAIFVVMYLALSFIVLACMGGFRLLSGRTGPH